MNIIINIMAIFRFLKEVKNRTKSASVRYCPRAIRDSEIHG